MIHKAIYNCVICSAAKKIGLVKNEEEAQNTCLACGHPHKEDGTCDCGCQ